MAPGRRKDLPPANKTFVDREEPKQIFLNAARSIAPDHATVIVFHGIGGQGKTALCQELAQNALGQKTHRQTLRVALLDLHSRSISAPERLLVWIRNAFSEAGIVFPCFDFALAITWAASRSDEPPPVLHNRWLSRHKSEFGEAGTEVLTAITDLLGGLAAQVPIFGAIFRSIGGWVIKKGYARFLHLRRNELAELYRDGQLKSPQELSDLLPWMLAQDLNHHVSGHPDERIVLLIDEYERVFDQGGAAVTWRQNPFDRHIRVLIRETNSLLAVVFAREPLPWGDDPVWRKQIPHTQHPLDGLSARDAKDFLVAIPIGEESIRAAIIESATNAYGGDRSVFPLLLDLLVEHWRSLISQGFPIIPDAFRLTADTLKGRLKEVVDQLLRDYDQPLQSTLKVLSFATFFDLECIEYVVRAFNIGLPLDASKRILDLSFVSNAGDECFTIHSVVAHAIRTLTDDDFSGRSNRVLFDYFASQEGRENRNSSSDTSLKELEEASRLRSQFDFDGYINWVHNAAAPLATPKTISQNIRLWQQALSILEDKCGPEHLDVCTALTNILAALLSREDYETAAPLAERALALNTKLYGDEHPNSALAKAQLSVCLHAQKHYERARSLLEEALSSNRKSLGENHEQTLQTMGYLAGVFQSEGDLTAAESLRKKVLAVCEQSENPEGLETAFALHQLASTLYRKREYATARQLLERALAIRERLDPRGPTTIASLNNLFAVLVELEDLDRARVMMERIVEISRHPEDLWTGSSNDAILRNYVTLAAAYQDFAAGRTALEYAVTNRQKEFGSAHPKTAAALAALGELLIIQSEWKEALPHIQRALAIFDQVYGEDHPDGELPLGRLAQLLERLGQVDEARPLYERWVKLRERVYGVDDLGTVEALTSFARFTTEHGDSAEAMQLADRALRIVQKNGDHYASDKPTLLWAEVLKTLAAIFVKERQFASAQFLLEGALGLYEKRLEPEHSAIVETQRSIGFVRMQQGDCAGAQLPFEKALAGFERLFGTEHHQTATALNQLAGAFLGQHKFDDAARMYQRALAIHERLDGGDHFDTAVALNNLGKALAFQGDVETAKDLYSRALAVLEKDHGPNHFLVADLREGLLHIFVKIGDFSAARALLEKALTAFEERYGAASPDIIPCLAKLCDLLNRTGDYTAARHLADRALTISELSLGPTHITTASCLSILARVLQEKQDYHQARKLVDRAVSIYRETLGSDHAATLKGTQELARLLEQEGDWTAALIHREDAVSICSRLYGSNDQRTLNALRDLSVNLLTLGELNRAEELLRGLLSTMEKIAGSESAHVAVAIRDLGSLMETKCDLPAAQELYVRLIAVCEKVYGADDLNTAEALRLLATLYQRMNDVVRYSTLIIQALEIAERQSGESSSGLVVADTMINLWGTLALSGKSKHAQSLLEQALAKYEMIYGEDNPEMANVLCRIAEEAGERSEEILHAALDESEARNIPRNVLASIRCRINEECGLSSPIPFLERALAINEKSYGLDHESTYKVLRQLVEAMDKEDRIDAVRQLLERVTSSLRNAGVKESFDTVEMSIFLGNVFLRLGQFVEASKPYGYAISFLEAELGSNHPSTINIVSNLASCLIGQADYARAQVLLEGIISARRMAAPEGDVDMATDLRKLGVTFLAQGNFAQAQAAYGDAVGICERILSEDDPLTIELREDLQRLAQLQSGAICEDSDPTSKE